jgi:hypothetical protein
MIILYMVIHHPKYTIYRPPASINHTWRSAEPPNI